MKLTSQDELRRWVCTMIFLSSSVLSLCPGSSQKVCVFCSACVGQDTHGAFSKGSVCASPLFPAVSIAIQHFSGWLFWLHIQDTTTDYQISTPPLWITPEAMTLLSHNVAYRGKLLHLSPQLLYQPHSPNSSCRIKSSSFGGAHVRALLKSGSSFSFQDFAAYPAKPGTSNKEFKNDQHSVRVREEKCASK